MANIVGTLFFYKKFVHHIIKRSFNYIAHCKCAAKWIIVKYYGITTRTDKLCPRPIEIDIKIFIDGLVTCFHYNIHYSAP